MTDTQRLLRQLGQSEDRTPGRGLGQGDREARMAASIDAELAKLVRARRAWRTLGVACLAAAALVTLALGLNQVRAGAGGGGIGQEPLASAPPRRPSEPSSPWPAGSRLTPPSASAPAIRSAAPASTPPASAATAPSARAAAESTLGEENRLFKAAAEASRQGDTDRSLAQLDQLLSEYPRSPLAQTAQVRKFRLLAKAGRLDAARREAARYLASYPTGFAVTEAETLSKDGAGSAPHEEPAAP